MITLRGLSATCTGPRFSPTGTVAGCASNDGTIYNECLWTIMVPRPDGPEWNGPTDCIPPEEPALPPPPKRPGAPNLRRNPPLPPFPDTPAGDPTCKHTGPSTQLPGNSGLSCNTQGACIDLDYDSSECYWRSGFLYCQACLVWPRAGSSCALSAASPIDYVCSGDELSSVLTSDGSSTSGGTSLLQPWQPQRRYCQLIRWGVDDMEPTEVLFSIKSGSARCTRRNNVTMTLEGLDAVCAAPRDNASGGAAGCQGNDNIDNECLWSMRLPRPGAQGWNGKNCLPAPPLASPPPPRVRRPANPSIRAPAAPPPAPSEPLTPAQGRSPPPKRRTPAAPGKRAPNAPPPPQPPVEGFYGFPFCACKKRSLKPTPYRLVYDSSTPLPALADGKERVRHCFHIQVVGCDSKAQCCGMGIKKIELSAENECRTSVKLALLAGRSYPWSFAQNDYNGETFTTFKLTGLGLEKPDVPDGMPLCIILTEPCSSLADFCYGGGDWCRFTFFSTDENCCPTGDLLASSDPTQVEVVDTAGGDVEVIDLRRRALLADRDAA
ncbi:hypothetical protein HXX76_015378 [Chlamydomonas incerta]|uniref:Pherophorin domain-containing protein n=1 Tax=Chlamydomonas incerta TaxID=51695 RepID=A0A835S9Y4_CHLIN|nr:hypothetical protein HXX76_015378 [Chlamydomonas incerta]|eukprot:KAG2423413.1 hypothetical protein HXX76_015378 [Chlamydomonas incerta]